MRRRGQRRAAGGHDAGAGPAAVRQGQLAGVEEKGDFTGAGLIDAVEAADDELRVADHAASHQVGELLQGLFVGHGQKNSERCREWQGNRRRVRTAATAAGSPGRKERTIPHFALIVKEKGGTALAVVRQFILPGGLQIGHG